MKDNTKNPNGGNEKKVGYGDCQGHNLRPQTDLRTQHSNSRKGSGGGAVSAKPEGIKKGVIKTGSGDFRNN